MKVLGDNKLFDLIELISLHKSDRFIVVLFDLASID